jgi:hypothetical protein
MCFALIRQLYVFKVTTIKRLLLLLLLPFAARSCGRSSALIISSIIIVNIIICHIIINTITSIIIHITTITICYA